MPASGDNVALLLARLRDGHQDAANQLIPLVYAELRRMAGAYMQRERPGQTLQATALVHEAYMRLVDGQPGPWQNRAHFFAIAAHTMRQVLAERGGSGRSHGNLSHHGQTRMEIGQSLASPGTGRERRMTPERWRQVKAIFDAAVECTPASRAELIRQRCGDDRELRSEVESLLASDRETGFLLDSPLNLVAPVRSQAPGTRLGPYEILALIGAGGMGEVYKARDTRLDRAVAIKVLPESFATDADRLRRFEIEAKVAGALNHPNILVVHDIGSDGGFPYLVSELLEGESLASRLQRGKLGVQRTVDYGKQIAAGLAAAHSKGISHRDIKPDNLYLTKDSGFWLGQSDDVPAWRRHHRRHRHGHGGVYVPGAGTRASGGSTLGYLQLRLRTL